MSLYLGIDIGSQGARAGVFDESGGMVASGAASFPLDRRPGGVAQYRSADIWQAVCAAVREAVGTSGPVAAVGLTRPSRLCRAT